MSFTFTADIAYRQFYRLNRSQWFNTPVHPSSNKHCFHIILSGCVFCGFHWGGGGKNWSKVKSELNFKIIKSELHCRALHTVGFILKFYSQILFFNETKAESEPCLFYVYVATKPFSCSKYGTTQTNGVLHQSAARKEEVGSYSTFVIINENLQNYCNH